MCGITAIFKKTDTINVIHQWDVHSMSEEIKHRGNDQVYYVENDRVVIGYRRFSITDIDESHHYKNNNPNWQVFLNGEIYNYKELGYFGTEKQVIEQGFEKEGIDFIKKLNGMFFILATHKNDVYLFRDRYGIKPGYIYDTGDNILISSEIKAFFKHPDFKFEINHYSVIDWMVFNNVLQNDGTLFEGVTSIEPGTIVHLNSNTSTKYWNWNFNPTPMDYDIAKQKVKALVIQAINRQIPSEVNYGTCLSSGIDSNIINKILSEDTFTFTAGFKGTNDETEIAKKYGKRHYEIIFDKVRYFEKTIYHVEDLRVGASWSNYGLYELASKYVKVLFDGSGSDELFGGYPWRYDMNKPYEDIINRTGIEMSLYQKDYISIIDNLSDRFLFDAHYFLPGVLSVVDKLSMAHTIEVRLPFLDNDLVDFCLTLPNEFKENKKILKDAFADILPSEILNQPKRGFSSPDWIEGKGNQAKKWAEASYNQWLKIFSNARHI